MRAWGTRAAPRATSIEAAILPKSLPVVTSETLKVSSFNTSQGESWGKQDPVEQSNRPVPVLPVSRLAMRFFINKRIWSLGPDVGRPVNETPWDNT